MRSKRTEGQWWIFMKCPVQYYCRARWHATIAWTTSTFSLPFYLNSRTSLIPRQPRLAVASHCFCEKFLFCFCWLIWSKCKFTRRAGGKIHSDLDWKLSRRVPNKILSGGFLLSFSSSDCLTCFFCFFSPMGSGPDITGSSHVSAAQPQKAPADHSSRQGGVGHRGRSYQRAAECEGQKSWCIQAHHTVTRHSSAQGPSEQAALTLNRLLMKSPAQDLTSKKCRWKKKNLCSYRKSFMSLWAGINTPLYLSKYQSLDCEPSTIAIMQLAFWQGQSLLITVDSLVEMKESIKLILVVAGVKAGGILMRPVLIHHVHLTSRAEHKKGQVNAFTVIVLE